MAKIRIQKDKAQSGHEMASVIFDKNDVRILKELMERHSKDRTFYLSNVRILKPGEKV